MPWDITYYDKQPDGPWTIGDMWPEPEWAEASIISKRYKKHWAKKRPPLMVVLPSKHDSAGGDMFLLDRVASGDKSREGWEITINGELVHGEKPDITVKPSINCDGSYHGFIRNGVITDDCEGRTYS